PSLLCIPSIIEEICLTWVEKESNNYSKGEINMTLVNNQIILAERPQGMPDSNTFNVVQTNVEEIKENQVLIKTLYVSVDPYMRGRMEDTESYVEPFKVNQVIEGGSI